MHQTQKTKLILLVLSTDWFIARICTLCFVGVAYLILIPQSAMAQDHAVTEARQFVDDALSDKIPPARRILKLQAAVFILKQQRKQQSPDRDTLRLYQQVLEMLITLLCEQKRYTELYPYYIAYKKTLPPAQEARKVYNLLQPILPKIVGNLKVNSQPTQVTVMIKDRYGKKYVKTTPFSIQLPQGTVMLSVQHPGYLPYQETLQLEPSVHTNRDIVLSQKKNTAPSSDNARVIAWSSLCFAVVGAVSGSFFLLGAFQFQSQSDRIQNNARFLVGLVSSGKMSSEEYDKLSLSQAAIDLQQQFVVNLAIGITFFSVSAIATGVSIGMFVRHRKKNAASTADLPTQVHPRFANIRSHSVLFVSE